MYRVEDKFLCSECDMVMLQSRVGGVMNPDVFSRDGYYRVTSLYFDDYTDSCLQDADDGVDHRNKYRIRIYNGDVNVIKLEVKYKLYNRVYKKSRTISKEIASRIIEGECVVDNEISMDNPITLFNLAISKDLLRPKVVVEYDRCAYVFSPGNVRITFDRNIRGSDDIYDFLDDKCSYTMVQDTNRILEVKYDEFLPGFIAQVLENGNMIQTAYSKYKLCREQMEEWIHVN
ncbi:MAG: polyphosphate polymerase domain-containing protein [Lachnospiraceae bacterium]|nr:polyphosphate polymerase domain-containing protein [Lachnospiraceae bacterium]